MVESCAFSHSTDSTPSVSPYGLPAPPSGSRVSASPFGGGGARNTKKQGEFAQSETDIVRIRLRFYKTMGAYCKPLSQALWACQLPFQGR